ncbi:MAG TPA: ABC transporter substrate-binding protein [Actinomycetota bacterium]|nr:ABC transporter substrate-binding protein [Actinomycetota bacterium]
MRTRRTYLLCACALVAMMVAAACGQKPDVYKLGAPAGAGGQAAAEGGAVLDAAGNPIVGSDSSLGSSASGGSGSSTTTTSGGGSGTDGGGDDGTPGDGPPGDTPEPGEPTGGNTTGVEDKVIRIGIHAPITGAAPVPAPSFDKGKDLYWNWLESQKKSIHGRTVQVFGHNDEFDPSVAVQECQEMVEDEKVFLIIGVAGADQIARCAQYANSVGVPYISAGVTETGVNNLATYFAIWASYKQQAPLLVSYMVEKLGARGEKNGMVYFNTPGFLDGRAAWEAEMDAAGASVDYMRAVPKNAGQTDAATVATDLCQQQIKNVNVLTSPTFFIQLASQANEQCDLQYVGVGLTMTIDTVAGVACRNNSSINNAKFLSPFPAYVDSNRFDPNFRKAGGTDDIMFGLWGMSKILHQMFLEPGRNLTRERFMWHVQRMGKISTGVLPDVVFSPTDHFGGSQMHMNRADCSRNVWVTEIPFFGGF